MLALIFDSFLMGFCFQLRTLECQESSPRCSESTIYQKIAFRNLYYFFFEFDSNMPPFSFQKSIKNASKLRLGRHHFFDWFLHRFFIDFPSIWDANLGLCWPLRRAQDASKTHPRRLQDGSQDEVRDSFRFWSNFGRFWVDFCSIAGWFLVDFGSIFGWFSIDFWSGFWLVFCSFFNQMFNDF